jgi:hypothetical protein
VNDWTTPQQVRDKVRKDWDRGTLAAAFWTGRNDLLPYRVALRGPSSAQWSDRFDEARRWIAAWEGFPVEWREFTHPRLGRNRVPVAVLWSSWNDLLVFIGKKTEAERFGRLADAVAEQFPVLRSWLEAHPLAVLAAEEDWPRLLAVLRWIDEHPRPGIYLRQIDLAGIHTKFIEGHRGLLSTLLDLILAPGVVGQGAAGAGRFAERYGFLTKPRFVRFRHLDPGIPRPRDMAWRLDDWGRWDPPVHQVFITENEINFLTFPDCPDSLVVFGAGYGFEEWDAVPWLRNTEVLYWGDLDTHGFAILDQLRSVLPGARSLMMDQRTLLAHEPLWGQEPDPTDRVLPRLTEAETEVYQGLVTHRWAPRLRLEQERIGYRWVEAELGRL